MSLWTSSGRFAHAGLVAAHAVVLLPRCLVPLGIGDRWREGVGQELRILRCRLLRPRLRLPLLRVLRTRLLRADRRRLALRRVARFLGPRRFGRTTALEQPGRREQQDDCSAHVTSLCLAQLDRTDLELGLLRTRVVSVDGDAVDEARLVLQQNGAKTMPRRGMSTTRAAITDSPRREVIRTGVPLRTPSSTASSGWISRNDFGYARRSSGARMVIVPVCQCSSTRPVDSTNG